MQSIRLANPSMMRAALWCLVLLCSFHSAPAPARARALPPVAAPWPQPAPEPGWRPDLEVSETSPAPAAIPSIELAQLPQARLPSLPSWARGPTFRGHNQWKPYSVKQQQLRHETIEAAGRAKRAFDFLLYGDSITRCIDPAIWNSFFPNTTYLAAPLGVVGNDIDDLAWRLITGSERPKKSPQVVALLIGLNNLHDRQPVKVYTQHLKYVLKWCQVAMPGTKLVLLGLIPNYHDDVRATNRAFKAMAGQLGIRFVQCGRDLNPHNKADLYDGTHPAPDGQRKLLRCVTKEVLPLLEG